MRCAPAHVPAYQSAAEMIATYATIRNHFFAHRSDRVGTTPPPVKRRAEPARPAEPPPLPVPVEDIVRAVCAEFEVKRAKLLFGAPH